MNLGRSDLAVFGAGVMAAAAASSWLVTRWVRRLGSRWRLVDSPEGRRKRHERPTPLLGGVALYASVMVVLGALGVFGVLPDAKFTPAVLFAIVAGGAALMIGGYLDDRYQLPPGLQIIAPLFAVMGVVVAGVRIFFVTNPLGGVVVIPALAGLALTPVWLLLMMYTTKLLDGVDGLVSSVTVIGALIIFILSLRWDAPRVSTALVALALAGAALGFLPWNLSPAKIFLGEGGSVFCGFFLGLLAVVSGSKITTTLLVMAVPMLDAVWVVGERLRFHASPIVGDRRHLHYRLLSRGWTPRQVVCALTAMAGTFGLIGVVASPRAKVMALVAALALVAGLLAWSRMPARGPGRS